MANNDITFTIDSSVPPVTYTFIGDTMDLPEGTITIDSSISNQEYFANTDFITFNTDYTVSDISVSFEDSISLNTEDE